MGYPKGWKCLVFGLIVVLENNEMGDCVFPFLGKAFHMFVACLRACGQRLEVMVLGHRWEA